MTEVYKNQILKFVSRRDYLPVKLSSLSKSLGVTGEDYPEFKAAFKELRQEGKILIGAKNLVVGPAMPGQIIGKFRANARGFGFVVPLEETWHSDLYIGPSDTGCAMTGDTVAARVVKNRLHAGRMRYSGEIIEVLQRGDNKFVGTLKKHKSELVVEPDG